MFSYPAKHDAHDRIMAIRHRRCGSDKWLSPPPSWREIVRSTWPQVIRNAPPRVPDGWCDIVLAMADHLEDRGVSVTNMLEDGATGRLVISHTWSGGQPPLDNTHRIIDAYELLSAWTCRECGDPGQVRQRGMGRFAAAKVLCDRHANGGEDE